ncbi:MAG: ECF transporter S component [Oscillospiraceae bacterium]
MHNRKSRTYPLAICAMLSAIILLLAFTPLGLIDLPLIKATILHVPVIIGAVLLGWRKGTLLGGVFGLASLV